MEKWKNIWQGMRLNSKFTIIIILFVMVPILFFSDYVFRSMEENAVSEKKKSTEYSLERSYGQIQKNVDSINMSTQFFLSDQALLGFLVDVKNGVPMETQQLRNFYHVNIASLERLVNNNPYLYQIRVYVPEADMPEMMPILYRESRMRKLSWAEYDGIYGWHFDYADTIFDTFDMDQSRKIMSFVSMISDYDNGELGVLEVAMDMETMFPVLYEEAEGQWSCFIDESGRRYYGKSVEGEQDRAVDHILAQSETDIGEAACGKAEILDMELHGVRCVAGVMPVKELSGTLITVNSMEEEIGVIRQMRRQFILIMTGALLLLVVLIHYVVKGVLKQFYEVLKSIRQVQKGDLNVVVENCGRDEMGELGSQINTMLERIRRLMEDNLKRELLIKNSEIKALQNQINAHFIYNVLESIKMMAEIDEKYEISDAITTLGKLLRYGMKWVSGNVTVEEEIEYIRNYLRLMNLRFDYEIILSINMPDIIYKQEIPKMTLQPIVENAIYHGIEQMAEDTSIYIKGIVDGEDCIIEITDSGRGMSEEELLRLHQKIAGEIETSGGSGNGIGLKNVQDRIKISFGESYGIEVASKQGCYTKIAVRIPLKRKGTDK